MIASHPDKPMSQVYGAVHLLRLFGKFLIPNGDHFAYLKSILW